MRHPGGSYDDQFHDDWDYRDDMEAMCNRFAYPGSNSALWKATKANPRNLPCPTCGCKNRLTPKDVASGYQCDACADRDERGF